MKTISVTDAKYLSDYRIEVHFHDHTVRVIDFKDQIDNIRVSEYRKYQDFDQFEKFKIENGNLVWGDDWDLIFPVHQLYEGKIR